MSACRPAVVSRKPRPLADPVLQVALTWVSAVLLGWPAIQIAGAHGTAAVFLYVFVIWSGLIAALFGVSRSLQRKWPSTHKDEDQDGKR